MGQVIETLLPVFLVIALGYGLARIGLLSETLISELNRLLFRVCLPALIVHALATASGIPDGTGAIILIFLVATIAVMGIAWLVYRQLGLKPGQMGTFVQAAFRGNLAYTGIPIVMYAMRAEGEAVVATSLAQLMFVFAPAMLLYNAASVGLLVASGVERPASAWRDIIKQIAVNPLIQASIIGVLLYMAPFEMPRPLLDTISLVGQIAAPASLLAIGGGMAYISMEGRYRSAICASLLKVAVLPLIAFALATLFGITGHPLLVLMVLSACPTAAASYIITVELKGDVAMAAGSIIISTVICIPFLALVIALI